MLLGEERGLADGMYGDGEFLDVGHDFAGGE